MVQLITLKNHRAFFVLIAFAAIFFLSDIWIYKEFVRAESYFALGARLMVETNEWLAPHAPDEMLLNKPPLTYWVIGISYKLFGVNYGTSRLPSVLAAIAVLAIVYALGVWLGGIRAGLISSAMLASSYIFFSFARMAMSDMLLTLWVTAALACFVVALTERTDRAKRLAILGYAAVALGVLTKGPVALVLIAAPITVELVLVAFRGGQRLPSQRGTGGQGPPLNGSEKLLDGATELSRTREALTRLRLFPGLILFTLIAAPYFFLVSTKFGRGPLRFFFFGENLQRFTGQLYGGSARPFWFSLASFFVDFAPWSLLIFLALWFEWRVRQMDESKRRARRILYISLACTIVLFSISSFKLDYYLLPAMPAAALLVGGVVGNVHKLPVAMRWIVAAFTVLCSLAILIVALTSLRVASALSVETILRFLPPALALLGTGAALLYIGRRKTWHAAMILMATIWATILSMQLTLLPSFVRYLPATVLAANVPVNSILYTSWETSGWANCFVFNLRSQDRVERLIGDANNEKLLAVLKNDPKAVAIVGDREYLKLAGNIPELRILAEAETFGRGGLSWKKISDPKRERLLLIGHGR